MQFDDRDVLKRVTEMDDFVGSVLVRDSLPDWHLARALGTFLVRVCPNELVGHVILLRALRHLGDLELARMEVQQCKTLLDTGNVTAIEHEILPSILEQEESILSNRDQEAGYSWEHD